MDVRPNVLYVQYVFYTVAVLIALKLAALAAVSARIILRARSRAAAVPETDGHVTASSTAASSAAEGAVTCTLDLGSLQTTDLRSELGGHAQ